MRCPACNHDNRPERRFCGECGQGLPAACPTCGAQNDAGEKFCGDCGVPLKTRPQAGTPAPATPRHLADRILAERGSLEGERKQVTVLFADVQGSMELAERLDPEDWSGIMQRLFQTLADGVERFEGFVDKFTGDGIMALFGAPIAHEDHAQRACHAALHLQAELRRHTEELKRKLGLNFAVRMGLHSGEVVVGAIRTSGDSLRMEYTAQGHTVGLASRMEQLAGADRIYVTDHTARLVSGYFQLRDLGQFQVKGVTEPLRVHELEEPGSLRTRFDLARAHGLSRFVGRASDFRALSDALAQAGSGSGQVLGVVAEAGTGKSRLCFEFLELCRSRGIRVYQSRAVAHGRNIPFLPILDLFRSCFGLAPQDDDACVREKISTRMAELGPEFSETVPVLQSFLGAGDPDNPGPRLDPDVRRRQLIDVLRRLTHGSGGEQPTVTMIEDLHWLDAASAEFLEQMVDARADTWSLLLLNFRPEFRAEWMQKAWYRQVPLTPFGADTVGELLADLLGTHSSVGSLTVPIHVRTGGNPFFVEEVAQSLIESGHLEGSRGEYRLVTAIDSLEVPATVQAVLAARIDRLENFDKQLLQTAAVIGKEFTEPVLKEVLAFTTAQQRAPEGMARSLRNLAQSEFLYERALYPLSEYTFKHPLTQEVAYESLLRERRTRVHGAVARAITSVHGDKLDENAALLAHHWEQAGENREAALWHRRAAEWSGVTNAAEGVRHWHRVRHLLRPLAHTAENLELGITACIGNLNLGWRLGTPVAEATEAFEEGRRLAEEADDLRGQAALHGAYGSALGLVGGDADDYWRYSLEATRLADRTGDLGLQIAQRAFLGFGSTFSGRMTDGIESSETVHRTLPADPALGIEFTGFSPYLGILMSHAWMLARLGRLDESTSVCDRAEKLARDFGDIEVLTWLQLPRIEVNVLRNDPASARENARSALGTAARASTPQSLFVGPMSLGISQALDGTWDEAVTSLEEALRWVSSLSNRMFEGWVRSVLSEALLGRGETDRAEMEATTAVAVAHDRHCRYEEARAHLAFARTQLQRVGGDAYSRTEKALARAKAIIDEIGARALLPGWHECRASLARLCNDPGSAKQESESAQRLYREMGVTARG